MLMPSGSVAVLTTYELVNDILGCLPDSDLLVAASFSSTFVATINQSRHLRRRLCEHLDCSGLPDGIAIAVRHPARTLMILQRERGRELVALCSRNVSQREMTVIMGSASRVKVEIEHVGLQRWRIRVHYRQDMRMKLA